jgi:hypothetical protein
MALPRIVFIGVCLALLAGCGQRSAATGPFADSINGPDEFTALPVKPLQQPADFATLPPPAPGAANLTDPSPIADAVTALGGSPAALAAAQVPAGDAALVTHAARYGRTGDIRAVLAGEQGGAAARQALDPYAELARFRALGVRTPSAPPGP